MKHLNYLRNFRLAGGVLLLLAILIGASLAAQQPTKITPMALQLQQKITATLSADPVTYTGPCPAVITFKGKITVTKACKLQYKFIRSDGALAPVQTLEFTGPGSKDVSTTWTLGGPGLPSYSGWEAIKVIYPQNVESNKANFTIRCQDQSQGDLAIYIRPCPKPVVKAGDKLGASFKVFGRSTFAGPLKDIAVDIILTSKATYPVPAPYAIYSPNYSDNVLLLGGREHISFSGPGTVNVKLNGTNTIPADTPTGNYYLGAVIDAGNKVAETNEKNNVFFCRLRVIGSTEEPKPEITGYAERCGMIGGNLTILGKNFGTQAGKGVALGGHGIHVNLIVLSWTNTKIIARIPNDPQIQKGQWYYTGIEKDDCSQWLSNISKNITICK